MSAFPYFKQLDCMDCGPNCLQMVAKHYGKTYTLQSLRSKSFITKSGVSMPGISDAAESIGFRTRGFRLTWEQLRDEVPLPCIVHWNQRHFVVVYRIKKRRAQSSGHRAKPKSPENKDSNNPEPCALSPERISETPEFSTSAKASVDKCALSPAFASRRSAMAGKA